MKQRSCVFFCETVKNQKSESKITMKNKLHKIIHIVFILLEQISQIGTLPNNTLHKNPNN